MTDPAIIKESIKLSEIIGQSVQLRRSSSPDRFIGLCPFHNERNPSFCVDDAWGRYKCFSCLEESELVWTDRGLIEIGHVEKNDIVIDRYGYPQRVIHTQRSKSSNMVSVGLSMFLRDPMLMTADHKCIFVKKEVAGSKLPFLYWSKERECVRIKNSYKGDFNKARISSLDVSEDRADYMRRGDYMLYPIIPNEARNVRPLAIDAVKVRHKSGVQKNRVRAIPVTERAARVYGLFLAEGSYYRGGVRWSFHINEKDTLAADVVNFLREDMGLNAQYFTTNLKPNSIDVTCSSTDLNAHFLHWFGSGCANKKIPVDFMLWPSFLQKSFFNGWYDGDKGTSVSKQLSYGMFGIAIQAGIPCSIIKNSGRDGRLDFWTINPLARENVRCFFQDIDGSNYFWMEVDGVNPLITESSVVDITVANTESFTTRMGVVHNCGAKGDVVQYIQDTENLDFKAAIKIVKHLAGIEDEYLTPADRRAREASIKALAAEKKKLRAWKAELRNNLICYTSLEWELYRKAKRQLMETWTQELEDQAEIAFMEAERKERALDEFESMQDNELLGFYRSRKSWEGIANPKWFLSGKRLELVRSNKV